MKFFLLFHSHNMLLFAIFGPLQVEMTDFPTLLYTSTGEIPPERK